MRCRGVFTAWDGGLAYALVDFVCASKRLFFMKFLFC